MKKIYRLFMFTFLSLAAAAACDTADPVTDDKNGGTEIPGDDLLEDGEVDMTGWPDYTKAEISASGPSVVVYSQNRTTVNGKPFLPMGIYGVNQADMPAVAQYGFNLIQSYQITPESTDAEIQDWLDTALENGLMVFINLDGARLGEEKVAKIKSMVTKFKAHPAIYAWYLADEPKVDEVTPAEITSLYEWMKNEDPNHPVLTSNWELWNFSDATDVDMRQLYDGVPNLLSEDFNKYIDANSSYIKTWVAIINSHDINWAKDGDELNPSNMYNGLTEGTPEWTAAEEQAQFVIDNMKDPEAAGLKFSSNFPKTPLLLRSSLYWGMAHGSNGFYYWLYQNPEVLNKRWGWYTIFHKPELNAAIPGILDEFARLSKYLVNPGVSSTSFTTADGMYVWSKVVDNRRLVIMINESSNDFEGEVDLSELYIPDRILGVFNEDGRKIRMEGNVMKDTFMSNETHVYFVE